MSNLSSVQQTWLSLWRCVELNKIRTNKYIKHGHSQMQRNKYWYQTNNKKTETDWPCVYYWELLTKSMNWAVHVEKKRVQSRRNIKILIFKVEDGQGGICKGVKTQPNWKFRFQGYKFLAVTRINDVNFHYSNNISTDLITSIVQKWLTLFSWSSAKRSGLSSISSWNCNRKTSLISVPCSGDN